MEKVYEVFESSEIEIKEFNYKELSLYLSLNKTDAEITRMRVYEYFPKRRNNSEPRPIMTMVVG